MKGSDGPVAGTGESVSCPTRTTLFAAFFRLGLTAFGGPAMVAYIRELAVVQRQWLRDEEFAGGVALAQTIPGATAMQTAAFVGLYTRGLTGALAAYVGFGLPAFVMMVILGMTYSRAQHNPSFLAMFLPLRAVVVAIVGNAAVAFGRRTITHGLDLVIVASSAALLWAGMSPLLALVLAVALGWLFRIAPTGPTSMSQGDSSDVRAKALLVLAPAAAGAAVLLALFVFRRPLFTLATAMMRIDIMAFGGGYAALPLMQREFVDIRHWLDATTFLDAIALGQVTPGPIVITATFAGFLVAGLAGAVVATFGIFFLSFLGMALSVPFLHALTMHEAVRRSVRAVLLAFVGLLTATTVRFATFVSWDALTAALAAGAFLALWRGVDVVWVVLACAATGIAVQLL
jgi:chromate transporter